jgi:anti-sigma regulatory factor (Ser/Thr protein kinase)
MDSAASFTDSHAMLLYGAPREHLMARVRYLRAGITHGAAVLIAATREHLNELGGEIALGGSGAAVCDLTSAGANPGRVLSVIRAFARENSARPIQCVLDVGWLERPREYLAEAIGYEWLLRRALARSRAEVLCSYDNRLDSDLLAAAEREHAVIFRGTEPRASATFAGDRPADQRGLAAQALSWPPGNASSLTFRYEQSEVRRFAADKALGARLPADRVRDLVIAVGELAGNVLVHTQGLGTLTIWTTETDVIFQVSDSGQIADPLAGTLRPEPAEIESHRGLWLVHQVGDLVQVRTGPAGTTVRVHMRLQPRAPEAITDDHGSSEVTCR